MNAVEGEAVARQAERNREWTQMDAPSPIRNRVNRELPEPCEQANSFAYLAWFAVQQESFGEIAGHTQVVDFHDISGYFSWFLWRPFAVVPQFLKVQKQLMQVVDFHDSFSYFWHVFKRRRGEFSASRFLGKPKMTAEAVITGVGNEPAHGSQSGRNKALPAKP